MRTLMIYVFWSCKDKTEAKKVIHKLLDERLIACASIFPEIESIYRWEGKTQEEKEVKVLLKTIPKNFEAIQDRIQKDCSYEVPEIVQVDITRGNPRFVTWIRDECLANVF